MAKLDDLEQRIGYTFRDRTLLEQALTHSSLAHERELGGAERPSPKTRDNEQLEFLGDAVLQFVASRELFELYPHYSEGQLTKLRAHLVSAPHLSKVAQAWQLGDYLLLGQGEERSGGRQKKTLLVDAVEATIAAVYLDGGVVAATTVVQRGIVAPGVEAVGEQAPQLNDYKSALQEWAQARSLPKPRYHVLREEGPPHRKLFTVELRISESERELVTEGSGESKKRAEQVAAQKALEHLRGAGHQ